MLWFAAVLVAVVSNLDNLAAGFALGMRDTRIGIGRNGLIAAVTMAGTATAMTSGRAMARLMSPALASEVGSLIIIAIGLTTVVAALGTLRRPDAVLGRGWQLRQDRGRGGWVSWREALVLGVGLSLNNVGTGVGAGIAGVSPLATTLLAGVISLVFAGGGSRAGWTVGRAVVGRRAPLLAGLVLVGVGIAMLSGPG